jgi:uncharacterized protein (TIGR00156 family)
MSASSSAHTSVSIRAVSATMSAPSRFHAFRSAFAGALIAFGAVSAFAQYTGPVEGKTGPKPLRTVSEIREHAKDDQAVLLTGVLAKKLGKEKYLFKDATGEISVEIDTEDFPSVKVDDKTRVEITGEVDKSALRAVEVDAKSVRVLAAE